MAINGPVRPQDFPLWEFVYKRYQFHVLNVGFLAVHSFHSPTPKELGEISPCLKLSTPEFRKTPLEQSATSH